jgi:hypothetical protein
MALFMARESKLRGPAGGASEPLLRLHLGTYDAPLDQLERLEGEVTVEVID